MAKPREKIEKRAVKKLLIRMPGHIHVKLKLIATAQGETLQGLVNDLLAAYVKRHAADVTKIMEGE